MECVSLVDEGWVFDKKCQSMDLNEYISIQYVIIVIIVLILLILYMTYLHILLLSEESTRRGKGRGMVTGGGKCKYFCFRIKHSILHVIRPIISCVLLESPNVIF